MNSDELTEESGAVDAVLPYQRIREDILSGDLLPEEKLKIRDLRQRYGTGTSPLREALNKLNSEGLVTQSENRGFRVARADFETYAELVQAKCWIESAALRESIANGSSEWEHGVVIAGYDLEKGVLSFSSGGFLSDPEFDLLHKRFHLALIGACQNNFVIATCDRLYDHTARYRRLYRPKVYKDTRRPEHKELSDAVLARDADKAVSLLCAHYSRTAELLQADMESTSHAWSTRLSNLVEDAVPTRA